MILFKTAREQAEWEDKNLDNRLKFIVYAIDSYMWQQFGLNLFITEVFRTQEEQDSIYANDPKYKEQKWDSVHQHWRGVDIRSSEMKREQIEQLVMWINNQVDYGKIGINTVKYHDVGAGIHIHVQVRYGNETILRKV